MGLLDGRSAVVTGGAQGIGLAIARRFVESFIDPYLAKTAPEDKYHVRAIKGYIGLARRFSNAMPEDQRIQMCQNAFAACHHPAEQKLVPATESPVVLLKNRPVWMSDFLAEQIAKTARPDGTHSAFDHQLLVDTVALLKANPWIRNVRQVRRAYGAKPGDTLEVDCDYRAPVALVQYNRDSFWLVDGEGVKLPAQFDLSQLNRVVRGADGKPAGIAAFVRDETERWREERELKRRVAELDAKGAS